LVSWILLRESTWESPPGNPFKSVGQKGVFLSAGGRTLMSQSCSRGFSLKTSKPDIRLVYTLLTQQKSRSSRGQSLADFSCRLIFRSLAAGVKNSSEKGGKFMILGARRSREQGCCGHLLSLIVQKKKLHVPRKATSAMGTSAKDKSYCLAHLVGKRSKLFEGNRLLIGQKKERIGINRHAGQSAGVKTKNRGEAVRLSSGIGRGGTQKPLGPESRRSRPWVKRISQEKWNRKQTVREKCQPHRGPNLLLEQKGWSQKALSGERP